MRIDGDIIAASLIFFGVLFRMSVRNEYSANPGVRFFTGLVLTVLGNACLISKQRAEAYI